MSLLDSAVVAPAAITGLAVTLTSASTTVTSAGLFTPDMVDREFTVSSSGIPGNTKVDAYVNASQITLSAAATASGARTATLGAKLYTFPNQATITPTHSKVDPAALKCSIVTPSDGIVAVFLACPLQGFPSAGTDTYLEWALLDAADTVVWPNSAGGIGRRVQLGGSTPRMFGKLEWEMTLDPNTAYDLYWGAGCGNQVEGSGSGSGFRMRAGATRGPAQFEVWT